MKKVLIPLLEKTVNALMGRLCQNWIKLKRNEFRYAKIYFSQYGEDIFIADKLKNISKGIYCDIGAYDPEWFSNTLILSKQGWHGINIDLDEEKIKKFKKARPHDISLKIGIGEKTGKAWAVQYGMPVLNRITLDPKNNLLAANGDEPIAIEEIQISTLNDVLAKYPEIHKINFLNIDCEGYEEKILQGINLEKYKPDLISVEFLDKTHLENLKKILKHSKYKMCGQLKITAFFEKDHEGC